MQSFFTKTLLHWHSTNNLRNLPWKNETDIYKIWLSEIMLQQTKAETVIHYYHTFTKKYKTVKALAEAPLQEVLKNWEGLGYYNRCKNLHHTAKVIAANKGSWPTTYNGLLALKGVGTYTAAAIASFAYNLPYAVVDGNVQRILSRYFGIYTPVDSTHGKVQFATLAQQLMPVNNAATYNQAIMDFGATVCKPRQAMCEVCNLLVTCVANKTNAVHNLPVKAKKAALKKRYLVYYIVTCGNKQLIVLRTANDVWQGLYEYALTELNTATMITTNNWQVHLPIGLKNTTTTLKSVSGILTQKLTHQHIHAQFVHLQVNTMLKIDDMQWVTNNKLKTLPFAAIINAYNNSASK